MPGRSGLATVLVIVLSGVFVADNVWARGRGGGHSGGKRGGGGHASAASSGGGARAAHAGAASAGGARMAHASAASTGGRMAAVNTGGANPAAAHAPAGAPAGGGRGAFARAGGGVLVLGAFPRIDGRFYGHPPPRTGAAVGMAAFWEVPPPDYRAPVVVVPYHPSEYIEMGPDEPVVAPPKNYWYFCPDAGGYYPYVDDCPGGWELVAPPGAMPTG